MVGEEQSLAMKARGTMVGAEMPCIFEGKGTLCPRLLLMGSTSLAQGRGRSRAEAEMTFEAPAIAFSAQELTCAWVRSSSGTFPIPVSVLHQVCASGGLLPPGNPVLLEGGGEGRHQK